MKNNIKNISTLLFAVLISFTACDTVDFGDLNVDPNSPSSASTASLLTNAEKSISGYISSGTATHYVQYLSTGQYDEVSRYQTLNWSFDGFYATLTDLNKIIELNSDPATNVAAQANGSNANQIAVATILKAYFFHGMTDRWGMIPYTQALQGLENPYPAYDSQQTIYNGLFNELDSALAMMDGGNGPVGDIILNGDMAGWATFANTIKLVMALRLSNADATTGKAKFLEAMSGAISSNSENIKYQYLSEDTNDNPWQDAHETRRDYLLSDTMVDAMVGAGTSFAPEDPRLEKFAEPAFNFPGEFKGAPYGISNSTIDDYSMMNDDLIFDGAAPLMIYTYAEVLFARAEAAALTWTTEDASALYEMAIAASMDQWGVDSTDADTYIALNAYGSSADIAYEKWVALYLQGYNSWHEWRRQKAMGYEKPLTAPADLLSNATGIPQRQGYSATASSLNEANYNAAVSTQGPDDLNTITWINQ